MGIPFFVVAGDGCGCGCCTQLRRRHKSTGGDYANPIGIERVILKVTPDLEVVR